MKRKLKLHSRRGLIWLVSAFGILAFLGVLYVFGVASPIRQMTTVRVDNGASIALVASQLRSENLIKSVDVFKMAVRLNGGRVQSGLYDIPARASAFRIARMMARGRVATTTIIIPEGLTVRQIKLLLLQSTALTGAVECETPDRPVCNLADGDLFPDTYRVARGQSRLAVLELARKKMADIADNWTAAGGRAPAPLGSWNDVVTLASIVQKETPRASEMPVVASVYLNRLRKNMLLQADPTVVYAITDGLGDMRGRPLLQGHVRTRNPYNTYVNNGLPPGPIANVGRRAIAAVLNPADTNYLFFVADGQGGHKFARTYEEHRRNHADWRAIKKFKNKK